MSADTRVDIDDLLARLGRLPPDPSLAQLEPHVWRRIASQSPGESASWGWRASIIAVALAFGTLSGSAVAARAPSELAPFSTHAALAPSTLLGLSE